MQVNLYGTMRLMVGKKSLQVDLPARTTLRHLLMEIIFQYPEIQPVMLGEDGDISRNLPLFINGRNPRLLPGFMDIILQPEDVISLFSPISSGRINVEALRLPETRRKEE